MKSFAHKLYWFILRLSRSNKFFRVIIDYSAYGYYKLLRSGKTFVFQGKKYKYFYHLYNRTVASERIVEIPIAYHLLKKYKDKEILEVGNVLSHYYPVAHDVLDKYEKTSGVINKDVVDFRFNRKYDLIISISTLEHVGFSKRYWEKRDPAKFSKAVKNLKRHLKKGGVLFATFPVFSNPVITDLIKKRNMPFNKEHFMKRTSFLNEWKQVGYKKAIDTASYDSHYANANALYIGEFSN